MLKNIFKIQNLTNIKVISASTLFAAISIIMGKFLALNIGDTIRFSFENLPIILSGIFFGPIVGALTGAVADILGCFLRGYPLNYILTIAAVFIGFAAGIVFTLLKHCKLYIKTAITLFVCHSIGSVIIKSIGLSIFYDLPLTLTLLQRSFNYICVLVCEFFLIVILLKNKLFVKQMDNFTR